MNRQMVVFGEDWGRHPSSTQHLIGRLMRSYEVLWVNSIGLRSPTLSARDMERMLCRIRQLMAGSGPRERAYRQPDNIITPRVLPVPGSRLMRWFNRKVLESTLLPRIDGTSKQRPLLWTSLPSAVDMVGHLNEAATIYYCGDDFSQLEGVEHAPIEAMEAELAEKADVILAASPQLQKRFPASKTHLLSHGVDYNLFARPAPPAQALERLSGPVVGFFGSINSWFDQDLVIAAARTLPGWHFMLVGPVATDVSRLAVLPNVHLTGPCPHNQLPGYVQHWDVSILPFKHNGQIAACNPLKLREYMAAGTAIVSTRFEALKPYGDLIRQIDDASSFVGALRYARAEGGRYRSRRQQRVADEDWSCKARLLNTILSSL